MRIEASPIVRGQSVPGRRTAKNGAKQHAPMEGHNVRGRPYFRDFVRDFAGPRTACQDEGLTMKSNAK
jgi:hypothetical protein